MRQCQADQEKHGIDEKAAGGEDDVVAASSVCGRVSPRQAARWHDIDKPGKAKRLEVKEGLAGTEQNPDVRKTTKARSDGMAELVRDHKQILKDDQKEAEWESAQGEWVSALPSVGQGEDQSQQDEDRHAPIKTVVKTLMAGRTIRFGPPEREAFLGEGLVVKGCNAANVTLEPDAQY